MKTIKTYRHLGYFNEVGDIRELSRKSADEILDYWKKGYGAFYEDDEPCADTDLVIDRELPNDDDVKITTDGKYAIFDTSWDAWQEDYKDAEDGDDSECYIDIYELGCSEDYDDEGENISIHEQRRRTAKNLLDEYHSIDFESESKDEIIKHFADIAGRMAEFIENGFDYVELH